MRIMLLPMGKPKLSCNSVRLVRFESRQELIKGPNLLQIRMIRT